VTGVDITEGLLRMSTSTMWTYFQAPTQIVRTSTGTDIAYRRMGDHGGTPLVLGNYFAANMDDWDPLIVDRVATDRVVIAFDYPGIGRSTGSTAATVDELVVECVAFLAALDLTTVDFLGFSLGGMVAQQLASSYPEAIRRMILCGTGPRGGVNMTFTELSIADLDDPEALLLTSFFTPSDVSQAAGRDYLGRLDRPEAERDVPVARSAAEMQLVSIREWGMIPANNRYGMLKAIHQPTLIVHGTKDVVVDVANAVVLEEYLSDAILLVLPDASHGAQSQYADIFLANAQLFLGD
jgi:pimeloyl-ACP methyl ester carboxylesterase